VNKYAALLLVVGSLQMVGDLCGLPALKGLGAATVASPAPRVFSAVSGLETYSTRFFVEWQDAVGKAHSLELTPEVAARIRGPYNRRNVYGAVLAYGPVLAASENGRRQLGIDTVGAHSLALRYEPLAGTSMHGLPTRIAVPLDR
jgi:hypothetical protein